MKELGYGAAYHLRWREIRMAEGETRIIDAGHDIFIFLESVDEAYYYVKVSSNNGGLFWVNHYNEQVYEHTGKITIKNTEVFPLVLQVIQAIPIKNK